MFSHEKNLLPLLTLFCILAFALSACEQLDWVLNSLVGWSDDTPTNCELEAFVVTTNLDIYNNNACNEAHCSLREAIQAANECEGPDTIILPGNFYSMFATGTGLGNERGDFNILDDVVISGDGIGNTIIEAPLLWRDRIFMIEEGIQVEIHDLTIKGGNIRAGNGGGIHNLGSLILRNVELRDNKAYRGGGLYNAGYATLESVNIIHNIAKVVPEGDGDSVLYHGISTDDCGGGITNAGSMSISNASYISLNEAQIGSGICNASGGDLTLTSSWVFNNSILPTPGTRNTTIAGGGISNFSNLTIEDTRITENNAHFGGGIFMSMLSGAEMHLTGVSINDNHAVEIGTWNYDPVPGGAGGGLYLSQGNIWITNSEISNNTAGEGGGLLLSPSSVIGEIANSAITNNQARQGGALSHYGSGSLRITNVTIAENEVPTRGGRGGGLFIHQGNAIWLTNVTLRKNNIGAIYIQGGGVYIRNTIIADNVEYYNCFFESGRSISSGGFNIVDDLTCLDGRNSTDGDLVDVELYSLQLGRSLTSIDGGATRYYTLLPGSVAIDRIDPTLVTCPPDDQRGVARPSPDGGLCDVGAYEASDEAPDEAPDETADKASDEEKDEEPAKTPLSGAIPTFTFTTDANCRQGPGTQYEIDASFLQGQTAQIDGRNQDQPHWWWVLRSNGDHCWVSDSTGTANGPTGNIQVVVAPAPPIVVPPADITVPPPPPVDITVPPPPQTVPGAPYKLYIQDHVCAGSTYTVTLAWGDTADNESGYRVYRDNALITTLGANAISYTDSPPTGGPYYYVVEAFNDAGAAPSKPVKEDGCIF